MPRYTYLGTSMQFLFVMTYFLFGSIIIRVYQGMFTRRLLCSSSWTGDHLSFFGGQVKK